MCALAAEHGSAGWHARLQLGFRRGAGRTILAERLREGPLTVQRALYPEHDLCHVYLLHPPGGVAGGDQLNIRVCVRKDASALITTPGATKFYRSVGPAAAQRQSMEVSGGSLEWLPQENILFPGAEAELSTIVHLDRNAVFIGWEINCLGRPVIDEQFDYGSASFSFSLIRDQLPVLHERMVVGGGAGLGGSACLRGWPVVGSLYATTSDAGLLDTIRRTIPDDHRGELGVTLVDGLLVARYLGGSAASARYLFTEIWKMLRPALLQRPPCTPRIWNT